MHVKHRNSVSKTKLVLFVTFCFSIATILTLVNLSNFHLLDVKNEINKNPLLFMTIMCNAKQFKPCYRAKISYRTCSKNFENVFGDDIIIRLLNNQEDTMPLPKSIRNVTLNFYNVSSNNVIFGYNLLNFEGIRYFLESTNASFYYRTTDDVGFEPHNLLKYLKTLNKEDILLKGQYVVRTEGRHNSPARYIHGGPGWIMSRQAAQIIMSHRQDLLEISYRTKEGDDVVIMDALPFLNLTPKDVHSPQFVGLPFGYDLTDTDLYNKLEYCREEKPEDPFYHALFPLKDAFALHSGSPNNHATLYGYDLVRSAPSDVYIDPSSGVFTKLCKKKPINTSNS